MNAILSLSWYKYSIIYGALYAYNYTKYSTWVPISHRFIVIVRSYLGSISSKSLPFVSGTHITTKNRPQHEMHAYNQYVPCNPSHSWNLKGAVNIISEEQKKKKPNTIGFPDRRGGEEFAFWGDLLKIQQQQSKRNHNKPESR